MTTDQDALALAEPILPPEGVSAKTLAEATREIMRAPRGHVDVSGVTGSAGPLLAARLANRGEQVVFVTADVDAARRAAADLTFLLSHAALSRATGDASQRDDATALADDADADAAEDTGNAEVLLLVPNESSPYADVSPDRRAAMARLATLFHLAKEPWRVLVVPAAALVRRFVPQNVLTAAAARVVAEEEVDRDSLVRALADAGYLRVPLVEDPGSFAVRGGLIDVWPASSDDPVRIELYGDLVVTIKPFDAVDQKTKKKPKDAGGGDVTLPHIVLPPVREAILSLDVQAAAKKRIVDLCDAIDFPTTKTRALTDDVLSGRTFFGADGYLPAYYGELATLFDYVGGARYVILDAPSAIATEATAERERAVADAAAKQGHPHYEPDAFYLAPEDAARALLERRVVSLHTTPIRGDGGGGLGQFATSTGELDLASRSHDALTRAVRAARTGRGRTATLEPLAVRIRAFREHGLRVVIAARAATQAERLRLLLSHQGITCHVHGARATEEAVNAAPEAQAEIIVGALAHGVLLPADGLALITEEEIFGQRAHRKRERRADDPSKAFLEDLRSLATGDFVVHVDHGIGRYLGLVHKDVGGMAVDLLAIEYGGGDKLYLPVYRLNQVQKYKGGENAAPKLDRLGGSTFEKTKARVRVAVRQMADELLRLYAERKAQLRPPLSPVDDDLRTFEATFPFDETPDQARAIAAVNADLEGPAPMDRLVCGDVGFGKTEVAMRAAFRVAMAGKQVAIMCPTTVLAQQHFRTFEARMEGHPLVIRAMSRFQTKREQDETMLMLKEGRCDIVVGTHRLLSKDIRFKDLGLLVVDEEQRFGVAHKERMKQLRAVVDVLTLTATPIPRTLQMAVGGMRDLSLITTPPADRRAVRTIVTRYDELVIKEAVERELARGGQIFYVYNRVEGLYERAAKLQSLVPSARIAVGHGQMARGSRKTEGGGPDKTESALEKTMLDFVEGRYDVLAATAIIESGLDIPRANTIIIDRADLFGLAQLYQLRGRVGRSKERAYCYLVVPPEGSMTDESRARIEALERHTELGSGFHIASLDLELRGAGDLLGAEQSGNVASVGFELFCAMLDEAVHELRGEPVVHDIDPELSIDVEALLPEDYVAEVGVRLSLYKRFASAIDEAQVGELAEEMENRFGPPPEVARRLVQLMTIKTELRKMRAVGCDANAKSVTLHLRDDTPLDSGKILELVRAPKSPYRLTPDMRLVRRFDGVRNGLANVEATLGELARCWK